MILYHGVGCDGFKAFDVRIRKYLTYQNITDFYWNASYLFYMYLISDNVPDELNDETDWLNIELSDSVSASKRTKCLPVWETYLSELTQLDELVSRTKLGQVVLNFPRLPHSQALVTSITHISAWSWEFSLHIPKPNEINISQDRSVSNVTAKEWAFEALFLSWGSHFYILDCGLTGFDAL
jgi:hypothetical protein